MGSEVVVYAGLTEINTVGEDQGEDIGTMGIMVS